MSLPVKEKRIEKYEIYILNNLLNSIRSKPTLQVEDAKEGDEEVPDPNASLQLQMELITASV